MEAVKKGKVQDLESTLAREIQRLVIELLKQKSDAERLLSIDGIQQIMQCGWSAETNAYGVTLTWHKHEKAHNLAHIFSDMVKCLESYGYHFAKTIDRAGFEGPTYKADTEGICIMVWGKDINSGPFYIENGLRHWLPNEEAHQIAGIDLPEPAF